MDMANRDYANAGSTTYIPDYAAGGGVIGMKPTGETDNSTGDAGATYPPAAAVELPRHQPLDFLKILATPVELPSSLLGAILCKKEECSRGITLGVAVGLAWYGWTRRDILGYALLATSAAAAIVVFSEIQGNNEVIM